MQHTLVVKKISWGKEGKLIAFVGLLVTARFTEIHFSEYFSSTFYRPAPDNRQQQGRIQRGLKPFSPLSSQPLGTENLKEISR